jgi:hypothetical protein
MTFPIVLLTGLIPANLVELDAFVLLFAAAGDGRLTGIWVHADVTVLLIGEYFPGITHRWDHITQNLGAVVAGRIMAVYWAVVFVFVLVLVAGSVATVYAVAKADGTRLVRQTVRDRGQSLAAGKRRKDRFPFGDTVIGKAALGAEAAAGNLGFEVVAHVALGPRYHRDAGSSLLLARIFLRVGQILIFGYFKSPPANTLIGEQSNASALSFQLNPDAKAPTGTALQRSAVSIELEKIAVRLSEEVWKIDPQKSRWLGWLNRPGCIVVVGIRVGTFNNIRNRLPQALIVIENFSVAALGQTSIVVVNAVIAADRFVGFGAGALILCSSFVCRPIN